MSRCLHTNLISFTAILPALLSACGKSSDVSPETAPPIPTAPEITRSQEYPDGPELLEAPFEEADAQQAQEEWSEYLGTESVQENSLGMPMVLIPPGKFVMGSPEDEEYSWENETLHNEMIVKPFYVGKYEVTQSEWTVVMGDNPSIFSEENNPFRFPGYDTSSFPVEDITWYDAIEFCNALSRRESLPEYYSMTDIERDDSFPDTNIDNADVSLVGGPGYRLLTEIEWEYCCRAGTTTAYHFGAEYSSEFANLLGDREPGLLSVLRVCTMQVGSFPANAFGLCDMHGNVEEWCWDAIDEYRMVFRGGNLSSQPGTCRSAYRGGMSPDLHVRECGLRVARDSP